MKKLIFVFAALVLLGARRAQAYTSTVEYLELASTNSIVAVSSPTASAGATKMEPAGVSGEVSGTNSGIKANYNEVVIDMSLNASSDLYCKWDTSISTYIASGVTNTGFQLARSQRHVVSATQFKPLYCLTDGATVGALRVPTILLRIK